MAIINLYVVFIDILIVSDQVNGLISIFRTRRYIRHFYNWPLPPIGTLTKLSFMVSKAMPQMFHISANNVNKALVWCSQFRVIS